jgi:hypothetical protein
MFAKRGGRESSSGPLADERLHELEVSEAREAVATTERQSDDELEGEEPDEPVPAAITRENASDPMTT